MCVFFSKALRLLDSYYIPPAVLLTNYWYTVYVFGSENTVSRNFEKQSAS
jgi:hypothetical protein